MPASWRIVAVGDLNGDAGVLEHILRGLAIVDRSLRWKAPRTHLIQIGDVFNRGGGAKEAFELLMALQSQAAQRGGKVSVLLGNHEVMTALGNEAYCTAEEYLAFASEAQQQRWPGRVHRAMRRLYRDHPPGGPILPLGPRLEAWKIANVPGRAAMRRALGPKGKLGRAIRELPVAVKDGDCVFVHASLSPVWARKGIDGLNRAARDAWAAAPSFERKVPAGSILRAPKGPLWNRELAMESGVRVGEQLRRALTALSAKRMVIGHSMTEHLPGGQRGRIHLRHRGKLVCIDVGLGRTTPSPCTALVIDGQGGWEWTPEAKRPLWRTRC